jgi:hypothetical protein
MPNVFEILIVLLLVALFFVAAYRQGGVLVAADKLYAFIVAALGDLVRLSPRRTLAIAWLAVKESIRKQAIVGLIIFGLILAFALWYLDSDNINPSALYISAIANAVNYLVLLMAVLTSTFSLPNDLKNKTIYTIVTKPVRPSEIVLGRIVGFTAVCTVPLVVMALCSYAFVQRALDHTHTLTEADLRPVAGSSAGRVASGSKQGMTSTEQGHRHRVILDADGNGVTEMNDSDRLELDDASGFQDRFGRGHWHSVTAEKRDGKTIYHVGPPEGRFHARVPLKGSLRFRDKDGSLMSDGYNVGNWTKRGYVAGGTLSSAIYTFENVRENEFPDGLRLEMDIRLFRTTKEDLNKPLLGSLVVRNPINGLACAPRNFAAREYFTLQQLIPRNLVDPGGKPLDLFNDLTVNGQVEIELQCIPRSQFFGVGPDDVYLLARERRFDINFAKGFVGIWLQMALAVSIGVFWSTFLSGPVAMLATAATIVAALLRPLLIDVIRDNLYEGAAHTGGVFESIVRLTEQKAIKSELDEGASTSIIQFIDRTLASLIDSIFTFVPDFASMNDIDSVARGFDVPADVLTFHVLQTLVFVVPLFLAGFVIFKRTEVAK